MKQNYAQLGLLSMTSSTVAEALAIAKKNIPLVLLALVFAVSLGMLQSTTTYARKEGGNWTGLDRALSYRDDYCYSSLAVLGEKSKQFGAYAGAIGGANMGGFSQGLVNALVRIPIYDWDQDVPQQPLYGTLNTTNKTIPYNGKGEFAPKLARTDAPVNSVRPIGYVDAFKFRVTPVPNVMWMADYATTQLPYDIGMLSMFVTGQNPVPMPREAVANPLMYQRLAVINSYGTPSNIMGAKVPDAYKNNPSEAAAGIGSNTSAEMPASEKQRLQQQYEQEIRAANAENGTTISDAEVRRQAAAKVKADEEAYILEKQREQANIYDQYGQSFATDEQRAQYEALKAEYERQAAPLRVRAAKTQWVWIALPPGNYPTADAKRAQKELDQLTKNFNEQARSINSSVADNQDKYSSFQGKRPDFMSALRDGSNTVANSLVNTVIGLSSHLYSTGEYTVSKSQSLDNCYENYEEAQTGGVNKVPSYAFSVPDAGVPITFPGIVYTGIALLMGKNWNPAPMPSMSGVTFYVGGSMNGKDMLDCYGRGKQGTIMPGNVTLGNNWDEKIFWIVPIAAAARAAEAALTASTGLPPGTITNLPSPKFIIEKYHNGISFGFSVNPGSIAMPDYLKSREIDFDKSVTQSIDLANLFTNSMWHEDSQNGRVLTPNLFIKLKKPYTITPRPVEGHEHPRPDGSTAVEVPIEVSKTGFKDAPKYEDKYGSGGKTYASDGRSFTNARIMKMKLEPGITGLDSIRKQPYYGHNTPDLIDGFADENGAGICNYLEGKLREKEASGKLVECEKVEDHPIKMEDGQGRKELLRHLVDIPAETPPGTKFCYAMYLDVYDNDMKFRAAGSDAEAERSGQNYWYSKTANWNSDYEAKRDKRMLSKVECIISGYKPSLQVRAGDMIVKGNTATETNRKDDLGSTETPKQKRTFGSWAEYGLFAGGSVSGAKMGSGAKYRVGQKTPENPFDPQGLLTFSNRYSLGTTNFGGFKDAIQDGFGQVTAFFDNRLEAAKPVNETGASCFDGTTVHLRDCASGDYRLKGSTDGGSRTYKIDGSGLEGQKDKSLVFMVGENVTVELTNNIKTPSNYDTITELSQVVFTSEKKTGSHAKYLVNIADAATRIDAWLINPTGAINTCYYGGGGQDTPTAIIPGEPIQQHPCYANRLIVNGPVVAERFFLRRSGGQDQNPAGNPPMQSIAGETFNLRPDAYLWAMNQPGKANQKFTTVDIKDLPPRY
jgi:hypothetical protein